jgi:hypothetical protein
MLCLHSDARTSCSWLPLLLMVATFGAAPFIGTSLVPVWDRVSQKALLGLTQLQHFAFDAMSLVLLR